MLKLAMAAASRNRGPSVVRKQAENLADLHSANYALAGAINSNRGLTYEVTGAPPRTHTENEGA